MTSTPGARPVINPCTVGTAVCAWISAALTTATDVPSSRTCAPPAVPVTTTEFSSMTRSDISMRRSVVPTLTVSVWGRKPSARMLSTTVGPVRPVTRNLPEASVTALLAGVPTTPTSTPASGRWLPCATTVPATAPSCARSSPGTVSNNSSTVAGAADAQIFELTSRLAIMCRASSKAGNAVEMGAGRKPVGRGTKPDESRTHGSGGCGITFSSRCDACDAERYTRCVALRKSLGFAL